MNTQKIFTSALIVLTGMMVAALAAYFFLTTLGYTKNHVQELTLPPATSALLNGIVESINLGEASSTDRTTFTIKTAAGEIKKIDVLVEEASLCPAANDIIDVNQVAVGDELAVRGETVADGSVLPCHDSTHYLKLIKNAPLAEVASTTPDVLEITPTTNVDNVRIAEPDITITPGGKLKAANFNGVLQSIDTGCFADGECFVMVDGKHVTVLRGWSQGEVGSVQGVPSFGDLESEIGKRVEVYVQDLGDGTYTLYGSQGFYIKLLQN